MLKTARSLSLRIRMRADGSLSVSVPPRTPQFIIKKMIDRSRTDIRALLTQHRSFHFEDGMKIGTKHTLVVRKGAEKSIHRSGTQLLCILTSRDSLEDELIQEELRRSMRAIIRKEAKQHLPARLDYLARTHQFTYSSLRFTHAMGRWGSCNSKKAISLNIALMNLPYELIDYVLIHELCHTVELNHSNAFWKLVEKADPDFKKHRAELKQYNPVI